MPSARFTAAVSSAIAIAASGCAASTARITALAASSGPNPTVSVALTEGPAEPPAIPLRRIHVYEATEHGLVGLAAMRADQLVGVARGAAPAAAFRARAADESDAVVSGLVADDLLDQRGGAVGELAALREGYAALDATKLAGVRADGTLRWVKAFEPLADRCAARAGLDLAASPSGRFVCVARTSRGGSGCADADAEVSVFTDGGAVAAEARFTWEAAAAPAACAVRDDGSAIALLPGSTDGAFSTSVVAVASDGASPLGRWSGAAIDAVPTSKGWAALVYEGRAAGVALRLADSRAGGSRTTALGSGQHALVGLARSLLVVSSPSPGTPELRVTKVDDAGRTSLEQRLGVAADAD